jgi:DNA-binding transcriptional regulator GbsR (MarR family)
MERYWLSIFSFLFSAAALVIVGFSVMNSPPPAKIPVVVDFTNLSKTKVFELAQSDLDEAEITKQTNEWATKIEQQLNQVAETYNLVILPKGIGVFGAQDITHLIEQTGQNLITEKPNSVELNQ